MAGVEKVPELRIDEVRAVASFRPSAAHALRPDEDDVLVALLADLGLHRVEAAHVKAAGAGACVLVGQAALSLIEYAEAEPVVVQSAFVEVATLVREATLSPAPREDQRSRIGLSAAPDYSSLHSRRCTSRRRAPCAAPLPRRSCRQASA